MADWAEIRRLQATLEQVQAASTAHKLSERNCVEIVKKLVEMKLLNILFTLDGKEYIVPDHLEKEIRNELEAHRGRINIVDLQQVLNVDLNYIQRGVTNLMRQDSSLQLLHGDLITSSYKDSLCIEINEILLQNGYISLVDLSTNFNLPLDFITTCVENALNSRIHGQLDKSGSGLLYTDVYVSRHKTRIRGLFSAVTRPTPIAPLITQGNFHGKLFQFVLHDLVSSEQLAGTVHGRGDKALYIPSIYTQMQNQWADNFLATNGYLEYDALSRLGIDDPLVYIRQRYKEKKDLYILESCVLGPSVLGEVMGSVEDTVKVLYKWVDVMTLLPSPCTVEDGNQLLQKLYGKEDQFFIAETVVAHQEFLKSCVDIFKPLLQEKAKKAVASSGSFLRRVSQEGTGEDEKRSGKQKKGKGKRQKERDSDTRDDSWEIKFLSKQEIENMLLENVEDLSEDFAGNLTNHLWSPLQDLFQKEAQQILAVQAEGEAGIQRKRHAHLQEGIQELWSRAKLFQKGLELFEDDLKLQLSKYLLRTLCTDMTNQVVKYLAEDCKLAVSDDVDAFNKERVKVINKLPDPLKKLTTTLNSSLTEKEVSGFFASFESLCENDSCGVMLRNLDKKKEKQLVFSHQQTLQTSLKEEKDPAMALHLTVVLLFQIHTGCLLHTPGRLLPQIITFLRGYMQPEDFHKLTSFQELVMLQLKQASEKGREEEKLAKEEGKLKAEKMEEKMFKEVESDPKDAIVIDDTLFDEDWEVVDVEGEEPKNSENEESNILRDNTTNPSSDLVDDKTNIDFIEQSTATPTEEGSTEVGHGTEEEGASKLTGGELETSYDQVEKRDNIGEGSHKVSDSSVALDAQLEAMLDELKGLAMKSKKKT